ncbi:hypothetical protein ACR76K_15175 [Enterococcus gallinarum]|uniref:hypothetical protein n=1 Tax=Enterococcus gallinarum TaxID=1353 RepID=UPI00338ED864
MDLENLKKQFPCLQAQKELSNGLPTIDVKIDYETLRFPIADLTEREKEFCCKVLNKE